MLQLVQASGARPSALAVRGMQATALCGRQSCLQAAFQAAVQQTTHAVRTYFSGFVFAGIPQRSLRNSSRIGNGGLKGRLQARLPATRKATRPFQFAGKAIDSRW